MAYRNYSYYLGLRKLAGLRSVAPAVAYFDTNFGQTAYAINKNEVFHLWGCEMTALRADCVRIRYKSSSTGQWVVIKDYLNQTSLSVAGSSSGPDHVQGFPQASGNFVGSDGNGNSTIYRANGVDYGNEEKPYGPIGQPVIWHNDGSYAEIDVLFENFSRAFKFLVPGYYSIDFDITKSALYKQLTTNNPIVNPDEMDYNNFSTNATVPWTPVDKATLEHGDLLVSNILVRCVDNVDVINASSYSLSPYAATSQRQSGLPTSSAISVYRNPGLVVNSIEYDSGTTTSAALASQDYIIYVSDSIGNDSWTGQESTVSGMNGPVKTIQKAATLARNYSGGQNVQIQIRGGNYKMLGTVTNPIFYLNANDSGKNGRFVTYKPFENEEVIISGSESISASAFAKVTSSDSIWNRISTAARGNVYVANVSAYDLGELPEHWRGNLLGGDDRNFGVSQQLPGVADLSFNGQKMTLSRWPNKSSLTSDGFTFSECATISSVIDTGTNGVYYVDPFYLSTQAYNASRTPAESTNGCYGRDEDGIADPSCFRNGVFTYSSNYDSVISKWKTSGLAEGIWLSGFWRWDWAFETYKIVSIDTSTRQITVRSKNSHYGIQNYTVCDLVIAGTGGDDFVNGSYIANPTPRRWVAYNILEELDSPGEYYIDRVNEKLYFWPPSAINSSSDIRLTHRAVAGPSAKSTGRFEIGFNPNTGEPSTTWAGDAGSGPAFPYPGWVDMDGVGYSQTGGTIQSRHVYNSKNTLRSLWKLYKVNNIIIEGLTFRDSAGSGLEMQLCENITVVKCKVNNIRNHGIKAPGGKNITIDSCTVYDIGLSGIINTGGNKQTLTPANKVITKCSVKRCNLLNQVETSVVIHGCGNTLSYSLISDGMTAVQCDGNNHIIEYNHFDNIGHGQDDAGTIYSGRNSSAFGHIIRYNFFNNCGSRLPGGCQYDNVNGCGGRPFVNGLPTTPPNPNETQWTIGVYWDDLESGHTVKGNVFYNCGSGPKGGACGFNGGVYHNVENNIIIGSAVGYGSSMYGSNYWNDSLRGKKWSTYNPNNWPWYETGGPLGPSGEVKAYTGYGPYNAEWVIGHGAGGFDSSNWAGIMHAVDIRRPEYVSSYPNLAKLIKQNANGDPELDITNINDFKNIAKNNVIVQCGQPLATWPGSGGGVPVGGWIVSGEVVTNTYPDFVNAAALNFKLTPTGLNAIRAQSPTFEDIPFENIPTKNYVPEAYSVNTTTGNKTSCSSDKYVIDTSYLPMFTSASNDQNISVPPSSVMRNFRNRIFDSVVFNGPGDFVMHEQLQSGARCAITVDMRNTRFYHCEFNSIVFGADSGSQLILDGSIFYSCDFRNCKFNISPKNMLFNKCRINNCHEFMNAYGAYGNAFAGLAANDVLNLFNFIGGKSGNDNNLFTFINVNSSLSQSTHNCFISCIPGSSGSGSFSGNIAFRNYVDGSDGDPVHIGKVNAHGNLFSNNYFFSSGKISLADNQKEKEKRFNKDSNQYPILRQYVQNTSTYDPLKDTNHWYTKIDIGTCGPNSTLFYDGMSSGFVSAWQGNRYGDVNGQTGYDLLTRAFPFECDPVDPNVSSPWHNAIYELTIDKYQWGFRSFQYNFLFGSCDGNTQVSFATWNKWKNNYTDTSPNSSLEYPNSRCKARWKGMTQAIRSVLEGNLTPKDGRQSIAEPCNVALYIQSCRGYFMYRNATNAIWNGLPGTNAQKDAAFYAILDDVINDIISIKGRTQSSGKMSVILDAVSYSATPSHIELFRSCSDYRTDALELADWYIKTKLEQAGIQVFYESKYKKTANKADIGNGTVSSISYPVGWAGVPFYADDYWIWYTSPNRPTPPGPGVFSNWVANSDVPIIYRGLNAYWPTNAGERAVDLYHSISTVNVGNAVRDLNINTADNPGPLVNYYTAQYAVAALYSWSDHFRYYENLKSGSGVYKGVLLSTPNYMNVDFSLVSNGYDVLPIYSTNPSTGQPFDPYNSYWRLSVIAAKNSVFFINGAQRYFDSASFVADPIGYRGVYWTQAGLNYWDQNIRQSSLADFVNVIRSFTSQAAPQSAVAEGWNGAVYPNDSWTKSIITSGMYSEWTSVPYVPDENFDFFAASWKAPVNVTRNTDLIVQSYFPWGRISANPAKDEGTPDPSDAVNFYISNNIPVGKRVMIPQFTHAAFIDSWATTQPGGRIQDGYHPDDACRDSSSNIVAADTSDPRGGIYAGIQSFASPWMDNATVRVKSLWSDWLDGFKARGGSIDYMLGDLIDGGTWSPVAYWSSLLRQDGGAGAGYLTHLNYIVNDPRTQSTTVGNAPIHGSLYSQLKLDQGQALSDFNTANLADGFTGGYKILNFVTSRLGAHYVNEGFYKPIQSKFPEMQVSNWMNLRLTESDQAPDLNGHRQQIDNTMGNAVAAVTYGNMELAGTVYEVNTSDPTTLSYNPSTTKRYGYDSGGNKSGWKCFLLDQQMLRANVRNLDTGYKLHIWIPTTATFNIASHMGGSGTLKQIEYWKELIKHDAMLCPEIFGYWNYYSFSDEDQVFADVLADINVQTDGKRMLRLPASTNKFTFNDHYLATGATKPNQTNLWRITTNYDTVNTLVVNSTSYNVRTTPGIWFVTTAMTITLTNYNAATKTLTLSAETSVVSNPWYLLYDSFPGDNPPTIGNSQPYMLVGQSDVDVSIATTGIIDPAKAIAQVERLIQDGQGSEWGVLDFEEPFDAIWNTGPSDPRYQPALDSMVATIRALKARYPNIRWTYYGIPRIPYWFPDGIWNQFTPEQRVAKYVQLTGVVEPLMTEMDFFMPGVYDVYERAQGMPSTTDTDATEAWWRRANVEAISHWFQSRNREVPAIIPLVSPWFQGGGFATELMPIPPLEFLEDQVRPLVIAGASGIAVWGAMKYYLYVAQWPGDHPSAAFLELRNTIQQVFCRDYLNGADPASIDWTSPSVGQQLGDAMNAVMVNALTAIWSVRP